MGTDPRLGASNPVSPETPGDLMPPPDESTDAVTALLADAPPLTMPPGVARRLQAAIAAQSEARRPPKGNPTETTTPLKRDTPLWADQPTGADAER